MVDTPLKRIEIESQERHTLEENSSPWFDSSIQEFHIVCVMKLAGGYCAVERQDWAHDLPVLSNNDPMKE